jgi:ankyrin repeat protein
MMSTSSNQEAMKNYERERDLLIKENKQAFDAVFSNKVSKMEKILKTDGIKQEAIDHLIFVATSVEMMKLFLRYGGDIHKHGPPLYPTPITLLLNCTGLLQQYAVHSTKRRDLVKLIEFLIEEGADVNAVDYLGYTPFINCATGGETKLCILIVEQGADPYAQRNDGGTALHTAAAACLDCVDVCRYLLEDCGLDIDAESKDKRMRSRTPLCLAALSGNIEVCIYLLKRGAKVDAGLQPLISAAQVYRFISHSARTATRKLFSFSWIMAPILFCMIQMDTVLSLCVVKKGFRISSSCSTNTAQETDCCTCLMERYIQPLILSLGTLVRRLSKRLR